MRLISLEALNVVTANRVRLGEAFARFAAVAVPQTRTHCQSALVRRGVHLSAPDGSADCLAADVEGEGETAVQFRYLAN